jgi:hypothetical protein
MIIENKILKSAIKNSMIIMPNKKQILYGVH